MQSAELVALELSVVLFLAHLLAQILTQARELDQNYLTGPRDEAQTVKGEIAGRAKRALANFLENYTPFVALDLALIATGRIGGAGSVGASLWIIARIIYLPVYLAGTRYIRTICWGLGILALILMLARLAGL